MIQSLVCPPYWLGLILMAPYFSTVWTGLIPSRSGPPQGQGLPPAKPERSLPAREYYYFTAQIGAARPGVVYLSSVVGPVNEGEVNLLRSSFLRALPPSHHYRLQTEHARGLQELLDRRNAFIATKSRAGQALIFR